MVDGELRQRNCISRTAELAMINYSLRGTWRCANALASFPGFTLVKPGNNARAWPRVKYSGLKVVGPKPHRPYRLRRPCLMAVYTSGISPMLVSTEGRGTTSSSLLSSPFLLRRFFFPLPFLPFLVGLGSSAQTNQKAPNKSHVVMGQAS